MKDYSAFFVVLLALLYGCAVPVQKSARDLDVEFQEASLSRASLLNEWWSK